MIFIKSHVKKLLYPLFLFLLTLVVYIFFAGRFKFMFPITIYNYFSYLAEAFLNGSLSFISAPSVLSDLTIFNGKIYMYWGPTSILPILPFVILFGKNISDSLYTAIIASFNPLILYFILQNLEKLMLVRLSNKQKITLCLFFSFGTVHFYLSIMGAVWFTSQIVSIFFLLLAIYFITSFAQSKKVTKLVLASLFFGFAFIARSTLIFNLPIFLAFILMPYFQKKQKKYLISSLTIFAFTLIFISGLNFCYNYLRFGSFLENGYSYHNIALHFAKDKEKFGIFNTAYIPKNLYYMLAEIPPISKNFPYFTFNEEGNSFLFTSPFFLILICLIRKKYWQSTKSKLINTSVIISSFLTIIFLLSFFGTGWIQFGYRYLLDIVPGLVILLAIVINSVPISIAVILFTFSVIINLLGTLWFMHF